MRFLLIPLFLLCGCFTKMNYMESAAAGGFLGAGTGAIIGSVITNGNIGESAALGAGIGVPAGLALAFVSEMYFNDYGEFDTSAEITNNGREISRREREIQSLRRSVKENEPRGDPDPNLRGEIFDGATIGNPYRL